MGAVAYRAGFALLWAVVLSPVVVLGWFFYSIVTEATAALAVFL
jgi:hypothetical protein